MKRVPADLSARWPALVPKKKVAVPMAPRPDLTALVLGATPDDMPVLLPEMALLEHGFIIGASGSGKSRCQFQIIQQATARGFGSLSIDPHATDDYRDSIVANSETEQKVHVIDLSANRTIGFNSFDCPEGTEPSVVAGNNMEAVSAGWEGQPLSQTPLIERNMSGAFGTLAELKLTMCEAPLLFDHKDASGLRRYAIQNVKDEYNRSVLARLQELSEDPRRKRDFDQEVLGPENRLARFLRPPVVRAMLGQTKNCLDLKAAMDNGDRIIANLSGGNQVHEKDADLVGRLLVRNILFHAKRRENKRPFICMLDEAPRYLSGDVSVLLAESRKFGVSVFCALQWLAQAEAVDENLLKALLSGTNIKICFRLRDAEEAERLARSLIRLNLERPVEALIKLAVIGHQRTLLNNESESEQQSKTKNRSLALGETETDGHTITRGVTHGRSVMDGTSDAESTAEMTSKSKGTVSGAGVSAGELMIPTDDPSAPIVSRTSAGASSNNSKSTQTSTGQVRGRVKGKTHAVTDTVAETESEAISKTLGKSRVVTEGEGETVGTGRSKGHSEALEPIMAPLPTAVHSMQNELYAAGQLLCGLKRGVGYLSYVGQKGPVATLFHVPFINVKQVSDERFLELRDGLMSTALPLADALQVIADRAENLKTPPPTPPQMPKKSPAPKKPDNPQEDHSAPDFY